MKKVLIGLLLIIPMAIVAAVVLVTNVVLITPDITVASVAIVDPDFYQDVDNVSLYFDRPGHAISACRAGPSQKSNE